MNAKLCPKQTTLFKKASRSKILSSNMMKTRQDTFFKKAYELSILCDVEVCVLYYGRDGDLIKTWPEDQSKVRDMAERFAKLSDGEKQKKSTNLSQFLNKKINDDKKHKIDKFSKKLSVMEDSLLRRLPVLQEKLRLLCPHHQTPDLSSSSSSLIDDVQTRKPCSVSTTDVSSSSVNVVDNQTEPITNHHINSGKIPTDLSTMSHESKYTIFVLDHEKGTFTQLGHSVSRL